MKMLTYFDFYSFRIKKKLKSRDPEMNIIFFGILQWNSLVYREHHIEINAKNSMKHNKNKNNR